MTLEPRFVAGRPAFKVPSGAWDCHAHVFGPVSRFPFSCGRRYTPEEATPEEFRTVLGILGIERVVLVQPSPYGADNSCLLEALAFFGGAARGVAVLGAAPAEKELETLHAAGVRGARLNFDPRERPRDLGNRLKEVATDIRGLGWHIELSIAPRYLDELQSKVMKLPAPLVLDHMAHLPAADFDSHPGFGALRRMLDSGRVWVKLSGAYRVTGDDNRLREAGALAHSLISINPERVVWGSDWPHTPRHGTESIQDERSLPFRKIDTGKLQDLIFEWADSEESRNAILVRNPARLYGDKG